jgi:hypothetical protein
MAISKNEKPLHPAIVGESNIGGPNGRKRAGVGSAIAGRLRFSARAVYVGLRGPGLRACSSQRSDPQAQALPLLMGRRNMENGT